MNMNYFIHSIFEMFDFLWKDFNFQIRRDQLVLQNTSRHERYLPMVVSREYLQNGQSREVRLVHE